ncbi:hypothetical protein [Xanthocytophaga agilis]|uniref:Uncharacterized protein n=1 Tax=Xanthocytophaga agilis TaxID=3048010 RepID=A0AAE3UEW2_9BACT|nr:hypothetical protein [Xanthocytophaga agilis]MDJ1503188.1 hypothetical protein [Xanthocytophaga agilis]
MDNFDDLKKLWQQMPASDLPSAQEMNQKVHTYQRKMKQKYIISIAYLAATFIFIGIIGYFIEPVYATTRIGVVIIMGGIVMVIISQSKLISLLSNEKSEVTDSRQYLQQMIVYQKNLQRIQTTTMSFYFLLLSIGLGLYMFEFIMRMGMIPRIITASVTAIWIAFNWFYIRPKQIAKHQSKTNEMITQLEKVCGQFE